MEKITITLLVWTILLVISCANNLIQLPPEGCLNNPADGVCRKICSWDIAYRIKSRSVCMRADYQCAVGEYVFSNWRGCGCARPVFCGK